MRIGVLGGTFDPIHCGHLQVADRVAAALGMEQVFLVPAGDPWMKPPPEASRADRLSMVELAIGNHARLASSSVDVDRVGPTYAVDTLADLQRAFPKRQPGQVVRWSFIVGADALADFMRWREPDRILQLADIVGVTRPGHRLDPPPIPEGRLTLLEVDSMDVSSSQIRDRVAAGQSIDGLVEPAVAHYIREHRLYREG